MGIELQLYRARIGRHDLRAPDRAHPQSHDSMTDMRLCAAVCIVGIVIGLTNGWVVHVVATSHCADGLLSAFSGQFVVTSVSPPVAQTTITMTIHHFDSSGLIILCGDVETNPGPNYVDEDRLEQLLTKMQQSINENIDKVRGEVRLLAEKIESFEKAIKDLRDSVHSQASDIDRMDSVLAEVANGLENVENRLEDQERRDRRDNVILYDVPEPSNEESEEGVEKFLDIVNSVLPDKLSRKDIVRAHRIGRKEDKKTRPLIARLCRSEDKVAILGKRPDFRKEGIGVGNDLTRQQRDMLERARNDGKIGYFRGGRFFTKPRPQPQEPHRPTTRSKARQQQTQQASGE